MDYVELSCSLQYFDQQVIEILIAELGEFGFESFQETEKGLFAYIPVNQFEEQKIEELPVQLADNMIEYSYQTIESKNWNEEWEKDYPPVIIENKCIIKAPFHKNLPEATYVITIEPKMSFGTGHHETTLLMVQMMLHFDFTNKTVLDIGCGTGVLAILASKAGAKSVFAADIDTWAYENTVDNIDENKCENIETFMGGMDVLPEIKFDVILANINRNILIENMNKYAISLKSGGEIFFSGIYKRDTEMLVNAGKGYNLALQQYMEKNNWVALRCSKTA